MRRALVLVVLLLTGCAEANGGAPLEPTPSLSQDQCHVTWNDPSLSLPTPGEVSLLLSSAKQQASTQPSVSAAPGPPASAKPGQPSYFLHLPQSTVGNEPYWIFAALHGFGQQGQTFSHDFVDLAERNNWILVAPTFKYTDLNNAIDTRTDDIRFTNELSEILRDVPRRTGLKVRQRALVLGFSRGASTAERFSLIHPEQVQAVAALSGGAYTLPQPCLELNGKTEPLPLPLGTADIATWTGHPFDAAGFRRIPFWVSVGSRDDQPEYLPSTYDVMIGQSRLVRAQSLDRSLLDFGQSNVRLTVFPGVGHTVTPDMVREAGDALARESQPTA